MRRVFELLRQAMFALNKKDRVYQSLLNAFLTRGYRMGEKLSVKQISEELGVSRQPIMTALYSLQERGFVKIVAQVGCEVVAPDAEEVRDFYRMFAEVEGIIAGLAASRCSPSEVTKLEELNFSIQQLVSCPGDSASQYRNLNFEFHQQLHWMARSPILSARQISNFELSDFFVVQTVGFQAHLSAAAQEHADMIEAIRTGDAQSAYQAAKVHIDSVAEDVYHAMQSCR